MMKFSLSLNNLKQNIVESKIEEILYENMKENGTQDKLIEFNDINLDMKIDKIILNSEICLKYVDDYLYPKGCKNIILCYFTNDSFGSIHEMKYRLLNDYLCQELYLVTPDKFNLETYQ